MIVRVLLKWEPWDEFGQALQIIYKTSHQGGLDQVFGNGEMRSTFLQCKMAMDLGGEKAELVFKKLGGLEARLCGFGQIIEASWFLYPRDISEQRWQKFGPDDLPTSLSTWVIRWVYDFPSLLLHAQVQVYPCCLNNILCVRDFPFHHVLM